MTTKTLSEDLTALARKRGDRGFCFRDLVAPAAYHGATVGELAEWMAQSRTLGHIETFASDTLPASPGRRFRVVVVPSYPFWGSRPAGALSTVPVTPSAVEPQ